MTENVDACLLINWTHDRKNGCFVVISKNCHSNKWRVKEKRTQLLHIINFQINCILLNRWKSMFSYHLSAQHSVCLFESLWNLIAFTFRLPFLDINIIRIDFFYVASSSIEYLWLFFLETMYELWIEAVNDKTMSQLSRME